MRVRLYLIDLLMQMPLLPSQLFTEVTRGRRWRSEPHTASCYKTLSPPGTEPWLKRQKPGTLPLDHIANLMLDQGQYWVSIGDIDGPSKSPLTQ